jgi:hypothetical protein
MHADAKEIRGPVASSRSLLVCLSPALLCPFIYIFWFRDILYDLTHTGDPPLLQPSSPANKREQDPEAPMASLSPPTSPSEVPRNISGSQRLTRHVPIPMRHLPLPQETHSTVQEDESQTQDQIRLLPPPPPPPPPPPQLLQAHRPLHAQRSEYYRPSIYINDLATLPPHGKFSMTGQSPLDYQSHSYWFPPTELASGSGSTTTNVASMIGNSDTSGSSSTFSYPIVTESKSVMQGYGGIGGGARSSMGTTDSSAMYNYAAPLNYHPGSPGSDTGSYVTTTRSNRSSYPRSSSPSGGSYAAPAASHAASALSVNSMGMHRGQSLGGGGMVHAPQGSHLRLVNKYAEQPQTPYIDPDLMPTWSTARTGIAYVFLSSSQVANNHFYFCSVD